MLTTVGSSGSTTDENPTLKFTGPAAALTDAAGNATKLFAPKTVLVLDAARQAIAPPIARDAVMETSAMERST